MRRDIVFMVPSAIYIADGPLSYVAVRSIYTPEERALQTKETIESIRNAVPNSRVVLSEVGSKKDLPFGIEKMADRYVYGGGNAAIRRIVDGKNKGHGEAISMILAQKAVREFRAKYYFKLSGRYKLDDRFDLMKWLPNYDCLLAIMYNKMCMSTRLYGFAAGLYETWLAGIFKAIPDLRFGWAIEDTLPKFISCIRPLEVVGVSGLIAPYGCGVRE